ncbi:hypothetical protein AWB71_03272 [Caballeronia peredens]|nr:hypothetical protein AWB71_03272 [Caballeronia peredens]
MSKSEQFNPSAEAKPWDGDSRDSRAAFRNYDTVSEPVSQKTPWQIWRDACAWQAASGQSIADTAGAKPVAYLVEIGGQPSLQFNCVDPSNLAEGNTCRPLYTNPYVDVDALGERLALRKLIKEQSFKIADLEEAACEAWHRGIEKGQNIPVSADSKAVYQEEMLDGSWVEVTRERYVAVRERNPQYVRIVHLAAPPSPSVADAAGASDVRSAALEEAYQAALSCDGALNNAGAVALKIRALINRDDAVAESKDAIEAKRYRFLRENMRFSSPRDETPTMTLRAPIPAPTHDIHNDWMGERFDASVDRTIDAAIAKELRK